MHYVFVLTTEPLYVTVIKCDKNIYQHIKNGGRELCLIPFIILQSLEAIMNMHDEELKPPSIGRNPAEEF